MPANHCKCHVLLCKGYTRVSCSYEITILFAFSICYTNPTFISNLPVTISHFSCCNDHIITRMLRLSVTLYLSLLSHSFIQRLSGFIICISCLHFTFLHPLLVPQEMHLEQEIF